MKVKEVDCERGYIDPCGFFTGTTAAATYGPSGLSNSAVMFLKYFKRSRKMKIKFKNRFHNTEVTLAIKKRYLSTVWAITTSLNYEVYCKGDDAPYAKRKMQEILDALCGGSDCSCEAYIEEETP